MRLLLMTVALSFAGFACGRPADTPKTGAAGTDARSTPARAPATAPIDVCQVITAPDAAAVLGPLPTQPPTKTDNAGFGVRDCMYVGPKLSGEGAQTVFSRLMVQAGVGSGPGDMIQADAERRHATIAVAVAGVGDSAKRSADGTFVLVKGGDITCAAQVDNGLPPGLSADAAASKLADLCRKVLAR